MKDRVLILIFALLLIATIVGLPIYAFAQSGSRHDAIKIRGTPVSKESPVPDNYILKYDQATDSMYWEADATGGGGGWENDSILIGYEIWHKIDTTTATIPVAEYADSATHLTDGTVDEADLAVTNSPSDNYILSYDDATKTFTWVVDQTGWENDSILIGYEIWHKIDTTTATIPTADSAGAMTDGGIDSADFALEVRHYVADVARDSANSVAGVAISDSIINGGEIWHKIDTTDAKIPTATTADSALATTHASVDIWDLSQEAKDSLYDNTDTQLTQEQVEDIAGPLVAGAKDGITITYQDAVDSVDAVVSIDSSHVKNGSLHEPDLKIANSPTDGYMLTYDQVTDGFEWVTTAGGGDLTDVNAGQDIYVVDPTGPAPTVGLRDTVNIDAMTTRSVRADSAITDTIVARSITTDSITANDYVSLPAATVQDDDIADGAIDGGTGGEIQDGTITADDLGTDAVSADELNASGVTSELEAVLTLSNLQGSVTDGQVPNDITIGFADSANHLTDGTVDEADLSAVTAQASVADNEILTYNSAGANFDWHNPAELSLQPLDADLTTLATPNNWRVFYSNGSNTITELALGADGTYLRSNGAAVAPTFDTPGGSSQWTDIGSYLKPNTDGDSLAIINATPNDTLWVHSGGITASDHALTLVSGTGDIQLADNTTVTGAIDADSLYVSSGSVFNRRMTAEAMGVDTITISDIVAFNTATASGVLAFGTNSGLNLGASSSTELELPNSNNPTTNAEGEIAWDANDDAIEVYSGDEMESGLIPFYQRATAAIWDPDGINDTVTIFHVDALIYPFGIEVDQYSITTRGAGAYTLTFSEYSSGLVWQATEDSVVQASGNYTEDATPMGDGKYNADDYIRVYLPATDLTELLIQIIFHVQEGN